MADAFPTLQPQPAPISVMIVDDSVVVRGIISRVLEKEPDIRVESSAAEGAAALALLRHKPVDVILLDIDMPVMDGLAAIPKILEIKPETKIIMVSTLTRRNAEISMKAIDLGAVDYVPKPSSNQEMMGGMDFVHELIDKIRAWGGRAVAAATPENPVSSRVFKPISLRTSPISRPDVVAIASSTGGPQALFKLWPHLKNLPQPLFITQHMPPSFTTLLAEHLTNLGGLPCTEAEDHMLAVPGKAYVAPGNFHMIVEGTANRPVIRLTQEPPENFCRPAADPMLRSLTAVYGGNILAIVLTGMGSDGFKGCRAVVEVGGAVIAQDEATSVVWGMPGYVAEGGLCHAVLPIGEIGEYAAKIASRSA